MKHTQQQLLQAVRGAGAGRESFSCADVRQQLGVSTKDRQKLNQFYRSFRACQAAASAEIEKIGTNCYRLRAQDRELPCETIESDVIEVQRSELFDVDGPAEPEAQVAPVLVSMDEERVDALLPPLPDSEEVKLEAPGATEPEGSSVASYQAESNEHSEPLAAFSAGSEEASPELVEAHVSVPEQDAVIPAWRGHVQRLGHRMRRLFGAGSAGASASREASVAAQV